MNGPRKLYVKSFGCQMNVYDSHRMTDLLVPEGFTETARVEDADLVILNTCHIREKAADKVYSELGRIRMLKQAAAQEGRRVTIAVAGCVAQAEGEEIIRRAPAVDLVVGPLNYHRLPGLLARAEREGAVVDTEFPVEDKFDLLKAPSREAIRTRGISAFVTVQEGCDKFCTFCVVPYTRGAETSRPVTKILAEVGAARRRRRARGHADRPERQCLSRRRTGRPALDARRDCCARSPTCRASRGCATPPAIRATWTTSLIAAHRDLPSLMPYLHLPVQSGSDRILAAMNRRHTRADYLAAIARMRDGAS